MRAGQIVLTATAVWCGLAVALAAAPRAAAAAPARTQVHYVMGTWLRIAVAGSGPEAPVGECFRDARALERVFSRWDGGSELTAVHAAERGRPQAVSAEMAALLARALALRAATSGAFDPTVGPLTALYRDTLAPDAPALLAARASVGARAASLDGAGLVLAPGARLDFDGVAKGWAVDRCVERLRAAGVRQALVSLGESSIAAVGAPDGGAGWPLAVRGVDPDTTVGLLRLRDAALSVSATHGGPGGGRPHVVDPDTGRLVRGRAVGVVVASSATDAEAWSKALLVWGRDGVERVEARGAHGALHVTAEGVRRGERLDATGLFAALPAPRQLAAAEEPLR